MGPRPASARWPLAQNRRNQSAGQRGAGKVPSRVESKKPEPSVPKKDPVGPEAVPEVRVSLAEAAVKASTRVARLEAALAILEDSDDADGAEVVQLKDSLKKARVQAAPTNPGRCLDKYQQYVARARRWLEKAQSAVPEAQRLAQTLQEQLDAGLAELEALRREASGIPQEPGDNTSELTDLRRQVQQLRPERGNWLSKRGHLCRHMELAGTQQTRRVWCWVWSRQSMRSEDVWGPQRVPFCDHQSFQRCALWIEGSQDWSGEASHPGPDGGFMLRLRRGQNRFMFSLMKFNLQSPTCHRVLTLRVSLMHWSSTCLGKRIECNTMPSAPASDNEDSSEVEHEESDRESASEMESPTNINDVSLDCRGCVYGASLIWCSSEGSNGAFGRCGSGIRVP